MYTAIEDLASAGGVDQQAVRARGAPIRFALDRCSLGAILIATSAQGIRAILLGDDRDVLVADLCRRFPAAGIVQLDRADPAIATMVAKVLGFVEVPSRGLELPLDIVGTAFQQRVWQALRAIPSGTTATYTEVARAIGQPAAARAVAAACAANAIAVAVPCHRVVRADGGVSGYRWGVARKRRLLEAEKGLS